MIIYLIFFLIVGFFGLYFGAKFIVVGLENLANKFGMSHLMVGLTILSIGTSLPEIAVSVMGGIDKLIGIDSNIDGIVIGNKVGSFFTNITLILGILGLSQTVFVSKWELKREVPMSFISVLIFLIFAIDGVLTRIEALFMIIAYILYLLLIIWTEKKRFNILKQAQEIMYEDTSNNHRDNTINNPVDKSSNKKDILMFVIGLFILIVAAEITVLSGRDLARELNISEILIGTLVIGLGTSLPELVTDLTAIKRGSYGFAVGDILGSNICDILLATSLGVIIVDFSVPAVILYFDIPLLFIAIAVASYFLYTDNTLKKWEGALLIAFYGLYAILRIFFFQS